jgi:hypothetical protein
LVFDDSEGMGNDDLIESKHATSGGSSDAFRRVGHHCGDDENARCDDGAESHDDAESLCESDEELRRHNGGHIYLQHERVLGRFRAVVRAAS